MSDKFANRYRIPSARLKNWDYSSEATYFITICTASRECLFGSIAVEMMKYSPIGQIVMEEFKKSFAIRAELYCEAFVVMPNHLHAILRIEKNDEITVETHGRASLSPPNYGIAYRAKRSISSFVAGFKSSATKRVNQYRQMPGMILWQERFHDHIIRNDAEYQRILEYIETNPAHWGSDTLHNA
jgi:REP element-mobilizing transposase RayT